MKPLYIWNGTFGLVLILTDSSIWEKENKKLIEKDGQVEIFMNLFNPRLLSSLTLFRVLWIGVLDNRTNNL